MYGPIPKDTLAEILLFLAERETFNSLREFGSVSRPQLRTALTELAEHLKQEARLSASPEQLEELGKELKKPLQDIVAKLPEGERERLLRGFAI